MWALAPLRMHEGGSILKRWWLAPITIGLLTIIWFLLPYMFSPAATHIEYQLINGHLQITAAFNQDIAVATMDDAPCDIAHPRTIVCAVPIDETKTSFKGTIRVETPDGTQGKLVVELKEIDHGETDSE